MFMSEGLSAPRPNPKLEDQPLSAVRDCLFNTFTATLRSERTSLHPQPEDAPCHDDKGPTKRGGVDYSKRNSRQLSWKSEMMKCESVTLKKSTMGGSGMIIVCFHDEKSYLEDPVM